MNQSINKMFISSQAQEEPHLFHLIKILSNIFDQHL